jgi:hypothetical protein
MFEVAREANLRTAWCDKHPAYDILNGPSGAGIQDLFCPEINSDAPTLGSKNDWTKNNTLTQQYDNYKVSNITPPILILYGMALKTILKFILPLISFPRLWLCLTKSTD